MTRICNQQSDDNHISIWEIASVAVFCKKLERNGDCIGRTNHEVLLTFIQAVLNAVSPSEMRSRLLTAVGLTKNAT